MNRLVSTQPSAAHVHQPAHAGLFVEPFELLDDDRVFKACVRKGFACPLLSELLHVVRTGTAAKHHAVAARGDFDFEILHPAARPIGHPLCNKLR
ncbi:unnamed protein product [Gemmata massiliana]|uniref:Uncharacterized protein n=1 Tax=Gemmata massiliana TaxID=1210884 RepID=A0A6P2DJI9_9BACT|nr:unnamed protein product [Gemmata massiliana]